MTVLELISQLQMLGVSPNSQIVIWDDKEREYELIKVDAVLKGEVVFDIKRTKQDYKD